MDAALPHARSRLVGAVEFGRGQPHHRRRRLDEAEHCSPLLEAVHGRLRLAARHVPALLHRLLPAASAHGLLRLHEVRNEQNKLICETHFVNPSSRSKTPRVVEDNCCMCNVAGVRTLSGVPSHDILYATFRNRLFEVPFLVIADHSTQSIVIVMRGSISLRDIFTDFTAASYELEAPELPPNCKVWNFSIYFMLITLTNF